ncbi:MAG: Acetate permease ActP (cation/acetate symporter), partial [uncultured Acetobacteraceae bacterium]
AAAPRTPARRRRRARCRRPARVGAGGARHRGRRQAGAESRGHPDVLRLRARHALHHVPGGAGQQVGGRFLRRGRRHHRLPERPGHRRRLHVGRELPRHLRPGLRLGLRRADLLHRLPGGLADRAVPDRGAAAQPRQVHLRRRRLLPAGPDADPHPVRHRHAGRGGLLPDRADGGRGKADRAAVRAALRLRGGDRRRADDRLRRLRRHEGHHLGADHQGLPAAGRRDLHGARRAVEFRLQPGGHVLRGGPHPPAGRRHHGARRAGVRPGVHHLARLGAHVRHRRLAAHPDALLHRVRRAGSPEERVLRHRLHRVLLHPDVHHRLRRHHLPDERPVLLHGGAERRGQQDHRPARRHQHGGGAPGQRGGRQPLPGLHLGGGLRHHPRGGGRADAGRRLRGEPRPLRRGDRPWPRFRAEGGQHLQDLGGRHRDRGDFPGLRVREPERRLHGGFGFRRRGLLQLPRPADEHDVEGLHHLRRHGGRVSRPGQRGDDGGVQQGGLGADLRLQGSLLPLRQPGAVLHDHRLRGDLDGVQGRLQPAGAGGGRLLRRAVCPVGDGHRRRFGAPAL